MTKKLLHSLVASLLLFGLFLPLPGTPAVEAETFASPAFRATWNRTDGPVAGGVARPYVWGKEPFATKTERYDSSPKRQRLVQYFDKGRMEITNPEGDQTNQWYVTSGLLVRDMIAGIVQTGDNLVQLFEPVKTPVVGDETNPLPATPTYSDFVAAAFGFSIAPSLVGQEVTRTIRAGGQVGRRAANASPKVKIAFYDSGNYHNIAAPFWEFLNATGPVSTPGGKTITTNIFEWQYILGFPLTEPYWTTARIGGQSQEVLIQLFERRVLYYNPAAPAGQQVDFTSVGRHWYNWQYSPPPAPVGDLSVPPSINGTIRPAYGNENTIFSFQAFGYKPGEEVGVSVTRPDASVLGEDRLGTLPANRGGIVGASFFGSSFRNSREQGLGIYRMDLKGKQSLKSSVIYWRLVEKTPVTPTTPYDTDNTPAPPAINAIVEPPSGPLGTLFTAFIFDFQLKYLFQNRYAAWITTPDGFAVNDDFFSLAVAASEALDGTTIQFISPPFPGLWAYTIAERANPAKQAILYFKVTAAPPELSVGNALRILTRGTLNSTSGQPWQQYLKWQDLRPAPDQQPQTQEGAENSED